MTTGLTFSLCMAMASVYWGRSGSFTSLHVMKLYDNNFTTVNNNALMEIQYRAATGNGLVVIGTDNYNAPNKNYLIVTLVDANNNRIDVNVPKADVEVWNIFVWRYDNSTQTLDVWVNGNHYSGSNAAMDMSGTVATDRKMVFGNWAQQNNVVSYTNSINGEFAERVIFDGAKGASEIDSLAAYLVNRYGLTWTNIGG